MSYVLLVQEEGASSGAEISNMSIRAYSFARLMAKFCPAALASFKMSQLTRYILKLDSASDI